MVSVRFDEAQKKKIEQRADSMNMNVSEYMRYLAESDTSGSDLEDDIQRLRSDIEELQDRRDELEAKYSQVESKIETKKSLIESKKKQIDERDSLDQEMEENLNYLAAMEKAELDSSNNPRAEEIVVRSDKFDSVDEVVSEAQERAEDVDALEYLPRRQLEQQSNVPLEQLTVGDAA